MKPVIPFLLWATCCPLHAAVVFTQTFESFTTGANLSSGSPLSGNNNVGARILDDTTATPFGTGNKFLAINGNLAAGTVNASGLSATTVSTHHFDLYEPTGATTTLTFGLGASDLNNNTSTGAFTAWSINNGAIAVASNTALASGSLPVLTLDHHYKAFVLHNGTGVAEVVSIPTGGTASLASKESALFFLDMATGTYIDGGRYSHTQAVTLNSFKFRAFSNSKNEIYIDNFTRDDTLTLIPEPSLGLLLAGAGPLAACRRRRAR
ncbi:hypothetical protein OVA24_01535 [Luteolibacter sp. SL250]|uniref:hypothetical protein n=1 Tax=Luteolibacter sp. SL250 TaxID=2995170 RepID=UPI0022700BBD|nr:hypothetical protein [Luteolibacter sp. SL250]WAC20059.1 hypothetical protein OVA24_01535 [Luteolibacter sp. SL250]